MTSPAIVREALVEALRKCRAQFDFYARVHTSTSKFAKAKIDQQFADMCDTALASVDAGGERG